MSMLVYIYMGTLAQSIAASAHSSQRMDLHPESECRLETAAHVLDAKLCLPIVLSEQIHQSDFGSDWGTVLGRSSAVMP